ncbi:MAG: hypothetical protein C4331_05255 [Meiothermus sp.]
MVGFWRGLALLLGLLAFTGCFEANLALKVYLNGRVEQILTLTPSADNPQSRQAVASFVQGLEGQGWKVEPGEERTIARRDLKGPGWGTGGLSLGTGAFGDEQFKLARRGWWLVETYRLEVSLGEPNPALQGMAPAGQLFSLFTGSLLPKLSLSLQTPLRASVHNADRVEGKTYTWNVNLAGANRFYIEYRIVRWDRVLLLAAGLLLVGLMLRWYHGRRTVE